MEQKEITTHQMGVVLSLSIISLKVLIFPAVVGKISYNNCYISVFISLAIDFLFMMLIVYAMKKNPDKTFFEIMEDCFGKVVAKIVGFVLLLFFLGKGIMAIKELQNYFVQLLFQDIQWGLFVFPLIALLLYIMNKSFRTFARSVEFFYYAVIAGAILTVLLPLKDFKIFNLLPFMADGVKPVVSGSFLTSFQFGDFLVLLMCMGRFNYSKKTTKTVIKFTLFTDLFIMLFFIVFVALFGDTVLNQISAVSDVPLYSNLAYNNGRLEWISIIIWTIVLIFQAGLMLKCACMSTKYVFNIKNNLVVSFVVATIIFAVLLLLYLNFADAIKVVISVPFASCTFAFKIVLILMLLIASWRKNNEKHIKKSV